MTPNVLLSLYIYRLVSVSSKICQDPSQWSECVVWPGVFLTQISTHQCGDSKVERHMTDAFISGTWCRVCYGRYIFYLCQSVPKPSKFYLDSANANHIITFSFWYVDRAWPLDDPQACWCRTSIAGFQLLRTRAYFWTDMLHLAVGPDFPSYCLAIVP